MATKKSSSKKSRKSSKKRSPRRPEISGSASTATVLAIEAAAPAVDCGRCVIRTIENHCGRAVGSLDDRLRDVCSPCDIGVMADLAEQLRESCGASEDLRLTCALSVRQVIRLVCG